jgi:hypothetical protein
VNPPAASRGPEAADTLSPTARGLTRFVRRRFLEQES